MIYVSKLNAGDKIRRVGPSPEGVLFDFKVGEEYEIQEDSEGLHIMQKNGRRYHIGNLSANKKEWEHVSGKMPAYIRILNTEKQYHTSFVTMTLEVDAEGERKLREAADNSQKLRRVATVDKKIAELEEELAGYKEERERLSAETER